MQNNNKALRSRVGSVLIVIGVLTVTPWPAGGQSNPPSNGGNSADPTQPENRSELEQLLQKSADLAQSGDLQEALVYAKKATQLEPQSSVAWGLVGNLHLNLNQLDRSIKALEKSKWLSSQNSGVLFSLGAAYFGKGDYARAKDLFEAGIKIKPRALAGIFNLGNTYVKLGQPKIALAHYRRAIAVDKRFWPALNNIGLIQYEMEDVSEAIQSWQKAQKIDENATEAKLALGVALFHQGEQAKGLSLVTAALKADPQLNSLDYLKANLWGKRLLNHTEEVFQNPQLDNLSQSHRSERVASKIREK